MFTGLVEEVGRVEALRRRGASVRIKISAKRVLEGTRVGDSIAVSGVCLTVTRLDASGFEAEMVAETAERSNLLSLRAGSGVNLECSLQLGQRLGGHLVLGHVDGLAKVTRIERQDRGQWLLWVHCPDTLRPMIAEKGSVALDGVSLTVADVEKETFSVALVPHTLENTTLSEAKVGQDLNLEADVLARYVARQLGGEARVTEDWLRTEGY